MATIANLTVALNADVGGFSTGINASKRALRDYQKTTSDVFNATRTDAERYEIAVRKIIDAYAVGKLPLELYQRGLERLEQDYKRTANAAREMAVAVAKSQRIKEVSGSAAQRKQATATGAAIESQFASPLETYNQRLRHLDSLLASGNLKLQAHARAVTAARAAYIATLPPLKAISDNTSSLVRVQTAMSKIGAVRIGLGGAAFATAAAGGIAKHSVGLASEFQATSISIEVLMKDVKASKALIEDLYQYAAKTPFEFPEVTAAAKQLLGFGVAAKDLLPTIDRLGNLSSALDIPLGELANLFGRNRNQAHIFSRDINEFTSRGIPIIQQLAKQFKVATSEVMGLVESGRVGFKDVEMAIAAMTDKGGQFEGMTDRLSTSMKGLASTAKDDLNSAFRALGDYIGPTLIPMLSDAAKTAKELAENLKGIEHSDVGKAIQGNESRLSEKHAFDNPSSIRSQIRRNIEEQKSAMRQYGDVNARMSRFSFSPLADATKSGILQKQLNQLAAERAALERLLQKMEGGPTEKVKGLSAKGAFATGTSAISKGADAASSALKSLNSGLSSVFKFGDKKFEIRGLSQLFNDMKKGGRLVQDLQAQIKTFGMTARSAQLYRASLEGVHGSLLKIASANAKRLEQMEFDAKTTQKQGERQQELANKFKAFEDALESPDKALKKSLDDIKKLEDAGFGATKSGRDILDRARGKAAEDFFARDKTNLGQTRNEALIAGTSGFYSAINRTLANTGSPQAKLEDKMKRILESDKRREQIQRQQLDVLKKQRVGQI